MRFYLVGRKVHVTGMAEDLKYAVYLSIKPDVGLYITGVGIPKDGVKRTYEGIIRCRHVKPDPDAKLRQGFSEEKEFDLFELVDVVELEVVAE